MKHVLVHCHWYLQNPGLLKLAITCQEGSCLGAPYIRALNEFLGHFGVLFARLRALGKVHIETKTGWCIRCMFSLLLVAILRPFMNQHIVTKTQLSWNWNHLCSKRDRRVWNGTERWASPNHINFRSSFGTPSSAFVKKSKTTLLTL